MKNIGFIGVGVMGKSMARNLMKNGFCLSVFTRTKSKADDLLAEGAKWCNSASECTKNMDAIITMVGIPAEVEEVYFGEHGILKQAKPGTVVIDMSTTKPSLSVKIFEEAAKKGIDALDAPVSGGDIGAKNGTLSIMVGGKEEIFKKCLPIFESMGNNIIYEGKAGNGQHTKMTNQIAVSGVLGSMCEAMAYAKKAGLDLQKMLESISKGAAGSWQMTNVGPKIADDNFAPGFFVDYMIKDLTIADNEAKEMGLTMPVTEDIIQMYTEVSKKGMGRLGTQALIKYFE